MWADFEISKQEINEYQLWKTSKLLIMLHVVVCFIVRDMYGFDGDFIRLLYHDEFLQQFFLVYVT